MIRYFRLGNVRIRLSLFWFFEYGGFVVFLKEFFVKVFYFFDLGLVFEIFVFYLVVGGFFFFFIDLYMFLILV